MLALSPVPLPSSSPSTPPDDRLPISIPPQLSSPNNARLSVVSTQSRAYSVSQPTPSIPAPTGHTDSRVLPLIGLVQDTVEKLTVDASLFTPQKQSDSSATGHAHNEGHSGADAASPSNTMKGARGSIMGQSKAGGAGGKVGYALVLAELRKERQRALEHLQQTYQELMSTGECLTAQKVIDDENNCRHEQQELEMAIAEYEADVQSLESSIAKGRESFEQKLHQVKEQTAKFKEELKELRHHSEHSQKQQSSEARALYNTRKRLYAIEEETLKNTVKELRYKLQLELTSASETQNFMAKKISKAEDTFAEWSKKYDTDIGALTQQVETLNEERAKVLDSIKRAEEEYEHELKRREHRNEKEKRYQEQVTTRQVNAVKIQCAWRQHTARKHLKSLKDEAKAAKKNAKGNKKPGKK